MKTRTVVTWLAASALALAVVGGCGDISTENIEVDAGGVDSGQDAGEDDGGNSSICGTFTTFEECEASSCGGFILPHAYCADGCDESSPKPTRENQVGLCASAGGNVGDGGVLFSRTCLGGGTESIQALGYEWVDGWDPGASCEVVDLGLEGD